MSQVPLSTLAPEYSVPLPKTIDPNAYRSSADPIVVVPSANPCVTCETPNPCATNPCATGYVGKYNMGWGWLGALILWFIIFTVLFWLIYYSLKPSFVLQSGSNQVDTAKVLLAAVISALILVIIIWLIKIAITRRY